MIYTHIAYAPIECEKNIGCAYNKFMEILPNDDDWGCFLDHDAMFTTNNWYNQLNDIIEKNPNLGAFGCKTNRVANGYQLLGNIDPHNHDISYHRKIGNYVQTKYYDNIMEIKGKLNKHGKLRKRCAYTSPWGFSGVFILLKKKVWKQINGFLENGFLGVDDDFRFRLHRYKIPFYIMNGIYVYHWYRADNIYTGSYSTDTIQHIDKMYKSKNSNKFDLNKIFLYNGRVQDYE